MGTIGTIDQEPVSATLDIALSMVPSISIVPDVLNASERLNVRRRTERALSTAYIGLDLG